MRQSGSVSPPPSGARVLSRGARTGRCVRYLSHTLYVRHLSHALYLRYRAYVRGWLVDGLPPCSSRTPTLWRTSVLSSQHITIVDGGRLLAEADVNAGPELVWAQLRAEAGHLPPGTRTRLVDAVLDLSDVEPG